MNGVLLDTHVLLWWVAGDDRLGTAARVTINAAPLAMFSAASIWELEIKKTLGKVAIPRGFTTALEGFGFRELPVRAAHAASISSIKLPHRDPFDRLLLAQASAERLSFVTADAVLIAAGPPDAIDARSTGGASGLRWSDTDPRGASDE